MALRAALLDLDGTLIDSAPCVVQCTRSAFGASGLTPPDEQCVRAFLGVPIERSFPLMGATDPGPVIACFRTLYVEMAPRHLRTFVGVVDSLRRIIERGVRCVVVTSKKRSIAEADCRTVAIDPFITDLIGSDCVARHKPDPDPALLALRRQGIDPVEAVVIGDAPVDIQMGRAAGVKTCAALWGAHDRSGLLAEHPDFEASLPSDLPALFA